MIRVIIKRAENIGFCSGVSRAVSMAEELLGNNSQLYVTGDLVHNCRVMSDLNEKGMRRIDKDHIPKNQTVLIQAHGASPKLVDQLLSKANFVVDGTCPIVQKSFDICEQACDNQYDLIVFGKKEHPEMVALKGLVSSAFICESMDEMVSWFDLKNSSEYNNIALCAQTTKPIREFSEFAKYLSTKLRQFGHLIVYNTICDATMRRESEIKKLAIENDCVIVIGGEKSSNTRKLYDIAKEINPNSYLIHELSDLKEIKKTLFQSETVVIGSGTSTPMRQVEEVENYIKREM